jgi:hypothetical protein
MNGKVPKDIKDRITTELWARADQLDWARLPDSSRAEWYENWSKDPKVGGILLNFMDARWVRVYIKDTLLKPYIRSRTGEAEERVFRALGMPAVPQAIAEYVKPHGRVLIDGRVVCWGNSRDWKSILISVFERATEGTGWSPFAAILLESGKTHAPSARALIQEVAKRLSIERLEWLD